jgi:predicted DNA-binding transcriptional regulator AlpA
MPEKLIPLAAVLERTGHTSATTIWRMRRANTFPEPVAISPNRKAWRETDIDAWVNARTPTSERSRSGGEKS